MGGAAARGNRRSVGGTASLQLIVESDGEGRILRISGQADSPLPALRMRLGTADSPLWTDIEAGRSEFDAQR